MADDQSYLWDVLGAPDQNVPRMLHAGEEWDGQPYVYIDDTGIEVVAGESDRPDQGLSVSCQYGTQLTGPLSLSEMPQNISIAGYYHLNPMLLACIGSSSAMPIPTLTAHTPPIVAGKSDIGSLVAGLGA